MRSRRTLTPMQIRKLLINPCRRDSVKLAKAMGKKRAATDCAPQDVRLLSCCIESLMGVPR